MSLKRSFIAIALVGLASSAMVAQAADSMVGTWKLNVAKSKTAYKTSDRERSCRYAIKVPPI